MTTRLYLLPALRELTPAPGSWSYPVNLTEDPNGGNQLVAIVSDIITKPDLRINTASRVKFADGSTTGVFEQ